MSVLGQPIPISNFLGTRQLPALTITQGTDRLRLSLDGANMTDPALKVQLVVDFSPDGGNTWATEAPGPAVNPYPVFVEFQGGSLNRDGSPRVEYFWESPPIPDGPNRKVRGTLVVTGAPLNTIATISSTLGEQAAAVKGK